MSMSVEHLAKEKEIHLTSHSLTDSDITPLLSKVIQHSNVLSVLDLSDNALTLVNIDKNDDDGGRGITSYVSDDKDGMVGVPLPPPPPFLDDDDIITTNDTTTATPIEPPIIQRHHPTTPHTDDNTTPTSSSSDSNELTEAIAHSASIHTLNLEDNQISLEGCQNLQFILKNNKSLVTLQLGGNKIGEDGLQLIAQGLSDNNTTLLHLNLMNNYICNGVGSTKLSNVLQSSSICSNLITLDLSVNAIGDSSIHKLSNALAHNTKLKELNLACNKIGDEGCESLANALITNVTLKKLWINRNKIGNDGIKAMGGVLLEKNVTLLQLWFHEQGDEGVCGDNLDVKTYMRMLKVLEDRKKNIKEQ